MEDVVATLDDEMARDLGFSSNLTVLLGLEELLGVEVSLLFM